MIQVMLLIDVLVTFTLICAAISEIRERRSFRLIVLAVIGVVCGYALLYIGVTNRTGR